MYRNIGSCYYNSGPSSEVGLSLPWSLTGGRSLIAVVPHQRLVSHCHGLSSKVSLSLQWSLIRGQSLIAVVPHQSLVSYCSILSSEVGLSLPWSLIRGQSLIVMVSHQRSVLLQWSLISGFTVQVFKRLLVFLL